MELYGALLLAHFLYDFHWQGDFVGIMKAKYNFILFIHALTYALVISAVLMFYGLFTIPAFLFLLSSHYVIDKWKCLEEDESAKLTTSLWIDQALHMLVLITILIPWGIK